MILLIATSFLIGLAAGLLAGTLGVGGGIVIVPALLLLFHLDGINPVIAMQLAVGTSLASIVVTNMVSTYGHHARQSVHWDMVLLYIPGIFLGVWFATWVAVRVESSVLQTLFGFFEIAIGLWMALGKGMVQNGEKPFWPEWVHSPLGVIIGAVSGLFGIGGGTLLVPVLVFLGGLPIRLAVGTSSAIGVGISVSGVGGYIQAGWDYPGLPMEAFGFIMPQAFFGIIAGTLLTTPLGVRLAHTLPPYQLKRGFGWFLILVGIKLIS